MTAEIASAAQKTRRPPPGCGAGDSRASRSHPSDSRRHKDALSTANTHSDATVLTPPVRKPLWLR